jgi:hypothetical protein
MALTNAEKQKVFRERRKAAGMVRRDEWIVRGGGIAPSAENGAWPSMTKPQLDGAIRKAVAAFGGDEMYIQVVYADIAAYAKKAALRFKKYQKNIDGYR